MRSKPSRWIVGGVLLVASCTSPGSSAAPTTSIPPAGLPAPTSRAAPSSAAPEPTGVPGLTAADPYCAAWAAYAGTLQALGVAASFGHVSGGQLAALELAAAPRLAATAAAIASSWPAELATEKSVVIDRRIGPYARRAQRAVDALRAAGVSGDELATLTTAWQQSLAERDPRVAVIVLSEVPADLQTKLDAAGKTWDADVTPFAQDPSLLVGGVATPATDQYLAVHCPDLASIGVGDAL